MKSSSVWVIRLGVVLLVMAACLNWSCFPSDSHTDEYWCFLMNGTDPVAVRLPSSGWHLDS
jgi:hypothetical protein